MTARRGMTRKFSSSILGVAVLGVPATNGALAEGAIVAGRFSDWSVHVSESATHKICFAVSEPKKKLPAVTNRATALLYISAWPKDGVRSEVSVKVGYPIKAASTVTVEVGKDAFKLFAKDERGFVADATEELKLIEAMKKGTDLIVKATSERGTATTDTYSLAGLSQALKILETKCP